MTTSDIWTLIGILTSVGVVIAGSFLTTLWFMLNRYLDAKFEVIDAKLDGLAQDVSNANKSIDHLRDDYRQILTGQTGPLPQKEMSYFPESSHSYQQYAQAQARVSSEPKVSSEQPWAMPHRG